MPWCVNSVSHTTDVRRQIKGSKLQLSAQSVESPDFRSVRSNNVGVTPSHRTHCHTTVLRQQILFKADAGHHESWIGFWYENRGDENYSEWGRLQRGEMMFLPLLHCHLCISLSRWTIFFFFGKLSLSCSDNLGGLSHSISQMGIKMENLVDDDCLKERKWWCFFLSSCITFVTGVASVLIVRAFNSVFRKKVRRRKTTLLSGKNEWIRSGKGLVGGRTVAFWLDEPSVQMQEGKKEGGTKRPIYISTMNYCLREARFLIYSPFK